MKSKKKSKCWDLETKITVIFTIPFLIVIGCVFLYALCYVHYHPVVLIYNKFPNWKGVGYAIGFYFAIIPMFDFSIFMMIKSMVQKDTEIAGILILNQKEEK